MLCHFLAVLIPRYRANESGGGIVTLFKVHAHTHIHTHTDTRSHTQKDGLLELFFDYMLHYSQLGASSYAFSEVYRAEDRPIKPIFSAAF